MVQAADLGRLDHLTGVGGRDGAGVGRIFHEGQMGPRAVVVNEVGREDSVQMSLAEDDYMVETFAADRSDQALDEGVLPRGTGCAHDLGDAHAFEAMAKGRAVNAVAIPHQVLGSGVVGKCLDDLLCGPSGQRGCSVTLKCSTRRRLWARTRKTKRTRKVAVGTVKKSIEARVPR